MHKNPDHDESTAATQLQTQCRHEQHFTLPSLHKRLAQQTRHYEILQLRHKQTVQLYNNAFEEWDDYCMNVLGVESDSLPLFPTLKAFKDDNNKIIDEYGNSLGKCVLNAMQTEFEQLCTQFVKSLSSMDNTKENDGSSSVIKCYGKDIAHAITYYRQFTNFISASSRGNVEEDKSKNEDKLDTLYKYVMPSSSFNDNNDQDTNIESLITQFVSSSETRTKLTNELLQLKSFLFSRKHEMSSKSLVIRSGRDVVDALELKWTQYCMKQPISLSSSLSCMSLDGISLDDLSRLYTAIHNVSMQIIGEGMHAKRIRFLADNVGVSGNGAYSLAFKYTCKRAANLAYSMTLFQDEQDAIVKMMKLCDEQIGLTKQDISNVECRLP